MASHWYGPSIAKFFNRHADALDLDLDTIKVGLSTAVHVPNPDDTFLDDGGTDDFVDAEATGTNYAGGFGGTGRKALASVTSAYVAGTNRYVFDAADLTWVAYNPTAAASQATVMKEITSDLLTPMIINLDFADVDPNGNDLVLQFHVDGIGYVSV